jgi:hypothetical protein
MKVIAFINLTPEESVYRFKISNEEIDQNEVTEWLKENALGSHAIWPCILLDNYAAGPGYTVELTGASIATMFRIAFSN